MHINLETKRINLHKQSIKFNNKLVNMKVPNDEENKYEFLPHNDKSNNIYNVNKSLNEIDINAFLTNKNILHPIISVFVKKLDHPNVVVHGNHLIKPMIQMWRAFDHEEHEELDEIASYIVKYNKRNNIIHDIMEKDYHEKAFIFYYEHRQKRDLFIIRFKGNNMFIESKCLQTTESKNVCRSIIYYLSASIDNINLNIIICKGTLCYSEIKMTTCVLTWYFCFILFPHY